MTIGIVALFDDKLIVPKTMVSRSNQNTTVSCMEKTEQGIVITTSMADRSYYLELTTGILQDNPATTTDRSFIIVGKDNKIYYRHLCSENYGIREFFQLFEIGRGNRMVFTTCEDRCRTGDVLISESRTPSEFIKAFNNMFPHVSDYYILDAKAMSAKVTNKANEYPQACLMSFTKKFKASNK